MEGYALGHSRRELQRLSAQARMFEPFTRRLLEQAGLARGMRVLDVGSGNGDVAFLAAELVGPEGEVTGTDTAPAAVETANERARQNGYANVTVVHGNPTELSFTAPFDAIAGRLVLMHQPDPAGMLRKLTRILRPGGIVAFQEFDIFGARSYPLVPLYEQCMEWIRRTFERTGTDSQMGLKLHATFVAAGLPAPSLCLDAGIWGGGENPAAYMVSEVIRSLLPALEKFGITTAQEVQIDSLRERLQNEILAAGAVVSSPSLIGAWTQI